MAASNRDNVFEQIQSICREYRKRLKSGQSANIADYLLRIDESARETLFQNLLHLDIEFYRRRGDYPSSESYIERFPQFARLIRQAFFESTMMSQEFDGDTPDADTPTVTLGIPAAKRIGEYELLRELGRGGFGVVYEARHLQRGDHVALKTLPMISEGKSESAQDAERLHRFRKEFRSLAEINHPNLVGMQSLELDGGQWFFTMDLIEGEDFLSYVRPNNQLHEERLRTSLKQLVAGIISLHEQRILHRDLKPSNVLIPPDGRVSILDFGLVTELQQSTDQTASMLTQHFAGTPRYAAPEQASGQRSEAVDWYALGVMLFEAITGEAPFKGSAVDLLIAKQTTEPPRLSGRDGIPVDLAQLVDRLLLRQPSERPSDQEVADTLGVDSETSSQHSTSSQSSLTEESATGGNQLLIGRDRQLTELKTCLQHFANSGESEAVFICGRSGEGKTSLAEVFLAGIRRQEKMLLLTGRCYDRESVPFKAIDCWIDPLVAHLRSRSQGELAAWLPKDISLLARLFPVLRRVPSIDQQETQTVEYQDTRQLRHRAFAALRDLLAVISRDLTVVLFIDDLQWGDGDSAKVLRDVLQPPHSPRIFLVGTYRSDEAAESPFLKEWADYTAMNDQTLLQRTIQVQPLSQDQCLLLMADRLGMAPEKLRPQARQLFANTRGNPYFLEQLIEGADPESGTIEAVPLSELIERRFQRLPAGARPLLHAISVAGQSVNFQEATDIAGKASAAMSILTHMRNERLVRLIGSGNEIVVDTYHDKIRETILVELPKSERERLHLAFAERLLSTPGSTADHSEQKSETGNAHPRVFDIAFHLLEAKDPRAFDYQLAGGEKAQNEYAMDTALEYLRNAQRLLPDKAESDTQFRLLFCMAEANRGLEQFAAAQRYYERAIPVAPNAIATARCEFGIGNGLIRQGRMLEAQVKISRALALLGEHLPSTTWQQLMTIQELYIDSYSLHVEAVLGAEWPKHKSSFRPQTAVLTRHALRLSRRARWICGRFPTLRPHVYRVSGRTALASGRPRKALKYFDEALRSAERIDARYEMARTLIDKSWLDHEGSAADRARGLSLLKELHCVLPEAEWEQLQRSNTSP